VIGPGRAGVRVGTGTGEAGTRWAGAGTGAGGTGSGGAGAGGTGGGGAGGAGTGSGGAGGAVVADSPIRTSAGGAWPGLEPPLRAWVMPSTARMTPIAATVTSSAPRVDDGMGSTLPKPSGPEMSLR
jgi:hypothetical protein